MRRAMTRLMPTMLMIGLACLGSLACRAEIVGESMDAPGYAAGELLVKVTPEAAKAIEAARADGRLPRTGLESLDALLTRFSARAIEPLFRAADPETVTARFPARAARAPEQADVPDLSRIYKITVHPATDLPAAVAAFTEDPHVEYAEPNSLMSIMLPEIDGDVSPDE